MAFPDWISEYRGRAVLESSGAGWTMDRLEAQCDRIARALMGRVSTRRPVGLIADNGADWIAVDLATHGVDLTLVPLPVFFSAEQLAHVVRVTDMQALFCADPRIALRLGFSEEVFRIGGLGLYERLTPVVTDAFEGVPIGVQKITFTSGTTGEPKGVCLSVTQQLQTAQALAAVTDSLNLGRHLNLLPLPVLLENIAGVYAPLMAGVTCICPALDEVGLSGGSAFDARRCLDAIARHAPDSVILLPQMLHALVAVLGCTTVRDRRIDSLKFVAVGGAKTPPLLIARARDLGLPVFEGYGLSECASVVALNVPGADRPGSVGRALPGTRVRVSSAGEIEVSGREFAGYLGVPAQQSKSWLKTGDLGAIDAEGFISVVGRTDNVLITGYGRNVSPEWPEGLLIEDPAIAQAAVFGEARPHLVAVIVAAAPGVGDALISAAVDQANRRLPDYARIGAWVRADESLSHRNGLATVNGRLRRGAILARYADHLNRLYAAERGQT